MNLRKIAFIVMMSFALIGTSVPVSAEASAKKTRKVVAVEGRISGLKNGKDRKKKRYWEYTLRLANGKKVLVHDYQYGRYRQPASMGLEAGAKRKVRGFYVNISTKLGSSKKEPVLIVSPAN